MASLELKIHEGLDEVPREAWDALLDEACTPFQRWIWLRTLESSGCASGDNGWHPRHLTLWRDATLVAAAPAYIREDSYGEFVFDWQWAGAAQRAGISYYPKLTMAVPFTPATGRRVLVAPGESREACESTVARAVIELSRKLGLSSAHVLFPTGGEAAGFVRDGWFERLGIQFHWQNPGYRGYDDFLARFNAKRRHQLRREQRAADEQRITLRTLRGDEVARADPAMVFKLYTATVDQFSWGRRYLTRPFFARILAAMPESVEVVEARRDGEVVAGAFNVASRTHLYGRYWGCFEEHPFLHFNVCYYHSIGECIARGVRVFEGGAGGDHKLSRGFEPTLTRSAHWIAHTGLHRAVRDFVARERESIEAQLPEIVAGAGMKPFGDGITQGL